MNGKKTVYFELNWPEDNVSFCHHKSPVVIVGHICLHFQLLKKTWWNQLFVTMQGFNFLTGIKTGISVWLPFNFLKKNKQLKY